MAPYSLEHGKNISFDINERNVTFRSILINRIQLLFYSHFGHTCLYGIHCLQTVERAENTYTVGI